MKKLSIDIAKCRVSAGGTALPLSRLEVFYYRYFAERVTKGLGAVVTDDRCLAPQGFSEKIEEYRKQSFPSVDEEQPSSRPVRSIPDSLSLGTFRTTISRLNAKIRKTLGSGTAPRYRINTEGPRNMRTYSLGLRKSDIEIKVSNVLEMYGKEVTVFKIDDPIIGALKAIRDRDFTHIVIRVDGRLRLLTTEGIAKWLADRPHAGALSLDRTTIRDVLKYERDDNMKCIGPGENIIEARDYFSNRLNSSLPNLAALIITQNGKSTGKALGIITAADFLDKRYW